MITPNINWTRVAAALAATSPYGPFFAPDGAIYGPDGSTLVPPADETACRTATASAHERGHAPRRNRRPWARARRASRAWRARGPVYRPRTA